MVASGNTYVFDGGVGKKVLKNAAKAITCKPKLVVDKYDEEMKDASRMYSIQQVLGRTRRVIGCSVG